MQRRRERNAYSLGQWSSCKAEDGSINNFDEILQEVAEKGLDLQARREVWPYLLGLYSPKHTDESKQAIYDAHKSSYQTLLQHCKELEAALQAYNGGEAAAAAAQAATAEADRIAAEAAAAAAAEAATEHLSPSSAPLGDLLGDLSPMPDSGSGPHSFDELTCPSGPTITLPTLTPRQPLSLPDSLRPPADPLNMPAPSSSHRSAPAASAETAAGAGPGADPSSVRDASITRDSVEPTAALQFCEAQRLIVMDAIRSNFKNNSLTKVDEFKSWWRSTIADNLVYQNLTSGEEWCRGYWLSSTARQALEHANQYSVEQKRQLVRLINLLSAYAVHDPETGYCQGMSDLALPFLMLMEDDDVAAFWCFEHLMRKIRKNFAIDETGIFLQLADLGNMLEQLDGPLHYRLRQAGAINCHFAYRMIVVLMRRELPLEQALRLWEMCWADDLLNRMETIETQQVAHARMLVNQALQGHSRAPSWQAPADERRSLFSYFVVAVVTSQRRKLLDGCSESDHILKHFQTLRVDMWDCIKRAQEYRLRHLGDDAPLHQRRKAAADPLPSTSARPSGTHHRQPSASAEPHTLRAFSPGEERPLIMLSDDEQGSPSHVSGEWARHDMLGSPDGSAASTSAAALSTSSLQATSSPAAPPPPQHQPMLFQRLQSAIASALRAPSPGRSQPSAPSTQQPSRSASFASNSGGATLKQDFLSSVSPPVPSPSPLAGQGVREPSPRQYDCDDDEDEPEGRPLLG